jgi:hypothetical protein
MPSCSSSYWVEEIEPPVKLLFRSPRSLVGLEILWTSLKVKNGNIQSHFFYSDWTGEINRVCMLSGDIHTYTVCC